MKLDTKIKSLLPGEKGKAYKAQYECSFVDNHTRFRNTINSIPKGCYFKPISITTADLISREDISDLLKGIKKLIKQYRAADRFLWN